MATVKEVFNTLNAYAPVDLKMDFDNVGHLVGRENRKVEKILVSLDITDEVIDEAKNINADLIVSHHPMFFSLKSVTDADFNGRKIIEIIENGMAAICMHTNLDAAAGGVNDALAKAVGIVNPELLSVDGYDENGEAYCIGRCGELSEPMEMEAFVKHIKTTLNCNGVRLYDSGKKVSRVAVIGGSGGAEYMLAIKKNCDTYVTADVKYHQFIECKEVGLSIIDAGHFCTENVIVPKIAELLIQSYPEIEVKISEVHKQIESFA